MQVLLKLMILTDFPENENDQYVANYNNKNIKQAI